MGVKWVGEPNYPRPGAFSRLQAHLVQPEWCDVRGDGDEDYDLGDGDKILQPASFQLRVDTNLGRKRLGNVQQQQPSTNNNGMADKGFFKQTNNWMADKEFSKQTNSGLASQRQFQTNSGRSSNQALLTTSRYLPHNRAFETNETFIRIPSNNRVFETDKAPIMPSKYQLLNNTNNAMNSINSNNNNIHNNNNNNMVSPTNEQSDSLSHSPSSSGSSERNSK